MTNRVQKIMEKASKRGIDALLLRGVNNVRYFTGYTGESAEILVTEKGVVLFTDFRYVEQAEKELAHIPGAKVVVTGKSERMPLIFEAAAGAKARTIGIDEDQVTVDVFAQYKSFFPEDRFAFFSQEIYETRMVKDEEEIKSITEAAKITDDAFLHVVKFIKPGMLETDVDAELKYFFNKKGLDVSFSPIVIADPKTSLPHGKPSEHKIESGSFVTMDFGCKVNGYCSDFTRTIAVGGIDREREKVYDIVKKAQKAALEAGKAGISAKMLDNFARQVIIDEGYGECFGHGLGHGVGLDIHEAPFINAESETVLAKNMVITIEPGIYLKEKFGIRIEDLCIVTTGLISLSAADKQLLII